MLLETVQALQLPQCKYNYCYNLLLNISWIHKHRRMSYLGQTIWILWKAAPLYAARERSVGGREDATLQTPVHNIFSATEKQLMADQAKRTVAETPEPWEAGYFNKGHWNWTVLHVTTFRPFLFHTPRNGDKQGRRNKNHNPKREEGSDRALLYLSPHTAAVALRHFIPHLLRWHPPTKAILSTWSTPSSQLERHQPPPPPPHRRPHSRPACRLGPRQRRGPTSRSGRSLQAPSQAWRAGAVRKRRVAPPAARDPPPLRGSQPARPHRPPRHCCAPAQREEPGGRSRAAWGDGKSPTAPCGLAGASEGNGGCVVRRAHQQPKAGLSAGRERPKGAQIRAGRARCGPAPHESGRTAAAPPPGAPQPPGSGTRAEAVLSLRPWRPLLRGRWAPERHMKRYAE